MASSVSNSHVAPGTRRSWNPIIGSSSNLPYSMNRRESRFNSLLHWPILICGVCCCFLERELVDKQTTAERWRKKTWSTSRRQPNEQSGFASLSAEARGILSKHTILVVSGWQYNAGDLWYVPAIERRVTLRKQVAWSCEPSSHARLPGYARYVSGCAKCPARCAENLPAQAASTAHSLNGCLFTLGNGDLAMRLVSRVSCDQAIPRM